MENGLVMERREVTISGYGISLFRWRQVLWFNNFENILKPLICILSEVFYGMWITSQ